MALALALACASTPVVEPKPEPPPPPPTTAEPEPARAVLHFEGIDAWLTCRRDGGELDACEAASAATPGGRLAEASRTGFGPPPPELPPPASIELVAAVVDRMRAWPDILGELQPFIPAPIEIDVHVFVVGNGHGFGDAYVREGDDGNPAALLNAPLIAAGYQGDAREKAEGAFGVLHHELFHAAFHAYRPTAAEWSAWPEDPSPLQRLQFVVLNEGIGHFADRRSEMERDGFPVDKVAPALARLADALARLETATWDDPGVEALVREANQGRYWDKYGAMVGMLIAYGVHRARGAAGIRESVRCGPGRFVALYPDAPDLPPLPDALRTWPDLCRS